jgi:hypothetical protein
VRIIIQPRNGDSFGKVVDRAIKILQDCQIASTQVSGEGGHYRPAVLIEPSDLPEVLKVLERAGMRVAVN